MQYGIRFPSSRVRCFESLLLSLLFSMWNRFILGRFLLSVERFYYFAQITSVPYGLCVCDALVVSCVSFVVTVLLWTLLSVSLSMLNVFFYKQNRTFNDSGSSLRHKKKRLMLIDAYSDSLDTHMCVFCTLCFDFVPSHINPKTVEFTAQYEIWRFPHTVPPAGQHMNDQWCFLGWLIFFASKKHSPV